MFDLLVSTLVQSLFEPTNMNLLNTWRDNIFAKDAASFFWGISTLCMHIAR